MRYLFAEFCGIALVLVLPAWVICALATGCMAPGWLSESQTQMFEPTVPIGVLALAGVGLVALKLCWQLSKAAGPQRVRIRARLRGQALLVLLFVVAAIAVGALFFPPGRVYYCTG